MSEVYWNWGQNMEIKVVKIVVDVAEIKVY